MTQKLLNEVTERIESSFAVLLFNEDSVFYVLSSCPCFCLLPSVQAPAEVGPGANRVMLLPSVEGWG